MSRFPRSLALAALVAFGTLMPLGALEVALRIYDATKPAPPEPRGAFWRPERPYGWLHIPGREGRWFDDHGEFSVTTKISAQGLRDVDHTFEKPPGVFRILLLGDSYMEGIQVPLEQTLPRLLERKLDEGGRRVEVINASAADWGTDNELVYLREVGFHFSPDLVLLAFTTANDVRNNSVTLNERVPHPNTYKTKFTLADDGSLVVHDMETPPPLFPEAPWWARSRALVFFANRLPRLAPSKPIDPALFAPPPHELPTDMLVYSPHPSAEVDQAWAVTRALHAAMRSDCESHGVRFAMFLVNGPWAHVEDWWKLMTLWDQTAVGWDRRKPNEVFRLFNRDWNTEALDLLDSFDAATTAGPLFFHYDPHWTAAGHRTAADAVAKFLVDRKLVPAPTGGRPVS